MTIQGNGFTVNEGKFDFFFGRVTSTPTNARRSNDNLENLKRLGIEEAADGRESLLQIFHKGLNAPEVPNSRKITQYGVNISRKVEVNGSEDTGAIIVRYYYPGGDLLAIPQVTSIVALIYKQEL